jgi:hypothetical protein
MPEQNCAQCGENAPSGLQVQLHEADEHRPWFGLALLQAFLKAAAATQGIRRRTPGNRRLSLRLDLGVSRS